MSFEDYERLHPNTKRKEYLSAVEKSYSQEARNKSSYGTTAEGLGSLSLTHSGYAAFLERSKNEAVSKDLSNKYALYKEKDSENLTGYLKYLEDYSNGIKKLKSTVTDNLIKNNVFDAAGAYNYAVSAGLRDEDAKAVSKTAYEAIRRKLISKVMERVHAYELDEYGAKEYALTLGLDEKDATSVKEYAEKIISERIAVGDEILEELRKIANKKYNK